MALARPVLRRAVLSLAVGAAAAGLAVPSAALPSRSGGMAYDARWLAAATHAAWQQFGDPSFPEPPVPSPTNRAGGGGAQTRGGGGQNKTQHSGPPHTPPTA